MINICAAGGYQNWFYALDELLPIGKYLVFTVKKMYFKTCYSSNSLKS